MIADLDPHTTPEDIRAAVADLSDSEVESLLFDWRMWARPEQVWPEGGWLTWLILGGRGAGKTRPGSEAVREVARDPSAVIALIGPTSADVRQVMVEGESGLLAVTPAAERPVYRPSIRELRWPSGARGYTYSAEEPERLRGPQHCLVGETLVLMGDGSEKPIRDVRIGDEVWTRDSICRVTAAGVTKRNTEVFLLHTVAGRDIIGTSNHPVWTAHGFVPLAGLTPGMSLSCATTVLNGMAMSGTVTGARRITAVRSDYTAQYGKRRTGASQTDIRCITLTKIRPTIVSKILNCSRTLSTAAFTCLRKSRQRGEPVAVGPRWQRWRGNAWRTSRNLLRAHVAAWDSLVPHFAPLLTAQENALKRLDLVPSLASGACALVAERHTTQLSGFSCTALKSAIREQLPIEPGSVKCVPSCATSASESSAVSAVTRGSAVMIAPWPSMQSDRVASVRKLPICADVYDISVAQGHEFFANGILVHNSFAWLDEIGTYPALKELWDLMIPGLRLGVNPRRIATTTPKPLAFLKDLIARPDTAVSRMRTVDNRANLPASMIGELERVYGGTRIGRQELEGELLEEAEGALWRGAQIEALRVRTAPELVRVCVAIDPSVTSGPDSDECGILVAGVGVDGHAYVLADRSGRMSPDDWAERAVVAFDAFEADKIIGEANNGGDLITSLMRTKRATIPFEKVHASRGKITRAEPIAALYEQAKVHHVGGFKELETEMTNYVPGVSKSPNRMDALVWALSFLMLKPARMGRALSL